MRWTAAAVLRIRFVAAVLLQQLY
uniref:Uncharacterized protein n=1 Tax=Rhizophora mucronata TaxID=61149 RepID=A0A2P2R1G2_RHIMU